MMAERPIQMRTSLCAADVSGSEPAPGAGRAEQTGGGWSRDPPLRQITKG